MKHQIILRIIGPEKWKSALKNILPSPFYWFIQLPYSFIDLFCKMSSDSKLAAWRMQPEHLDLNQKLGSIGGLRPNNILDLWGKSHRRWTKWCLKHLFYGCSICPFTEGSRLAFKQNQLPDLVSKPFCPILVSKEFLCQPTPVDAQYARKKINKLQEKTKEN